MQLMSLSSFLPVYVLPFKWYRLFGGRNRGSTSTLQLGEEDVQTLSETGFAHGVQSTWLIPELRSL